MKQALEPLAAVPGVRVAMLVTNDGVPITVIGDRRGRGRPSNDDAPHEGPDRRGSDRGVSAAEDVMAWAALGAGWVGDIARALAPIAWNPPQELVLEAARGTLVVRGAPGALLFVVLRNGTRAADLRLPMDAAIARIERHLRDAATRANERAAIETAPSILPTRSEPRGGGEVPTGGGNWVSTSGNGTPEVSGE